MQLGLIEKPRPQPDLEALLGLDRDHDETASRRLSGWWVALAVALVGIAIYWWAGGQRPALRYVTEPAARGALTVIVTATGSVQPTKKVDVSSELSGTVRNVLVDYNSLVKTGETLAELDTDKLIATVESARARLAAARAKVLDAQATVVEKERELGRKRALSDRQIASTHDLDLAQAAHDRAMATLASANADVRVAEAELKLNDTNLAKARIISPIDGVVLKRNVDPGQTVASSFQAPVLFTIAENLQQMELQVDVDEADVGKVAIGQTASFSVDAYPDRKFPARIRDLRFASETVQGVVTYKAVLTIDNAQLLLRPGMTATAEIRVLDISDALLATNAALRFVPTDQGAATDTRSWFRRIMPGMPQFRPPSARERTGAERTIWVLREGEPVAVDVVIGASDGRQTEVVSGAIRPGDALIVDAVKPKS